MKSLQRLIFRNEGSIQQGQGSTGGCGNNAGGPERHLVDDRPGRAGPGGGSAREGQHARRQAVENEDGNVVRDSEAHPDRPFCIVSFFHSAIGHYLNEL